MLIGETNTVDRVATRRQELQDLGLGAVRLWPARRAVATRASGPPRELDDRKDGPGARLPSSQSRWPRRVGDPDGPRPDKRVERVPTAASTAGWHLNNLTGDGREFVVVTYGANPVIAIRHDQGNTLRHVPRHQ